MAGSREGFTVRVHRSGSAAPAGVGFVVDDTHIITCAHVVNTALGRDQRAQDKPSPQVRVEVEFPMLGDAAGGPSRSCEIQAWAPPPSSGVSGGDIAGLVVVGEGLPRRAGPARMANPAPLRDVVTGVFGYPGDPPRQANGAWAELRLRGAVGGGVIQLDSGSESAIRAQPGYSGSPVIVTTHAGDDVVLGMLAVVSGDGGARDAYAIPVPELARAWPDVVGRLTIPACPYRGLGSFTAEDAEVFVGRDDEVSRLLEMVRRQSLVIVTGPSGVGKSSLVNAGLIPQLREQGWAVGGFRSGGMPVDALAAALAAVQAVDRVPTVTEIGDWAALLRCEGLASAGVRLAQALARPVVLHMDQLEEILDPEACSPDVKADYLELLLSARAAPDDGLHLVGTLRADFWTQFLEHPDAGTRLAGRWFGLSPMGKDRLEKIIAEPARAKDVHYQDGLVRVIAEDAGGGHGLPLLEFALTQLWPHQQGRQITWAAYKSVGGVTGALSRHAAQAYRDLLSRFPEERIRRVMLALVRSRGGAAEATRRVVSREQLGRDWEVAQALAQQRLLIASRHDGIGDETAEIAHEALIREWPTLASWVNDDADFQHWLISAEERAADGELLPDHRLAEADRWLGERAVEVPREVKKLVQNSKSAWLRRITELENARNRAEARRLAAAAELALTSPVISLQIPIALAVEALKIAPVLEADIATRQAIRAAARQISCLDHDGIVYAVAFSPDGTRVATGSDDGSARVFNAAIGTEICRLNHGGRVHAVAFSSDGARVAAGSSGTPGGGASVFNAATGAEIARLDHDGDVSALAFSPDSSKVAVGSRRLFSGGGGARVFDATTGAEIARLKHEGIVSVVAFSPDGTRVVTGSQRWLTEGGGARVFDAASGAEIARLDHDGDVSALAFSPDGTRVVIGSGDQSGGSARVFNTATGAEISRMEHNNRVHAVAFSPDGTRVATGSSNLLNDGGSVRVFDAHTGAEIARLDQDGDVSAVAFSPDGTRVAIGSGNRSGGSARVFDAATGAETARLDQGGRVHAVAFSPDGTLVATGGDDWGARVFGAAAGAEIARMGHDGIVRSVAFSPDGAWVATCSGDSGARIFDAATGAEVYHLDHDGFVYAVMFSPDGARVVTGSGSQSRGSARIFDVATGTEVSRLDRNAHGYAMAFSPDGTRVAACGDDGSARVFDTATGAEIARMGHDAIVRSMAFGPDGTWLAASADDWGALVFDAATGTEIARLDHGSRVRSVTFSPDGTWLAVGGDDGSARVFDTATGAEISRMANDDIVRSVMFSLDKTRVATRSDDGSARVFDAATGAEIYHLDHDSFVYAVAFSPDGARVATGSGNRSGGSARVFDAVTGTEVSRLDHDGFVYAVAFSPDGTRVATGSSDRSARVWCVDDGQLIQQATRRLTRNLTQQEWRRYFRDQPYHKTRADLP